MYYKLSNNTDIDIIESEMKVKFRFPDLYDASSIIDGLNEESLPVITSNKPNIIDYGIWGILPHQFRDEWKDYQKIRNTLNVDIRTIDSNSDYYEALEQRRCVIIISGFFTSYNFRGQIYPVYVYPKKARVFSLAAIYNVSYDGFITFTVLLDKSNYEIAKLHNISDSMPIILDNNHKNKWLSEHYEDIIWENNDSFKHLDFSSHTIAKEFYKNNILFDSVLDPVVYKDLINS